MGVTKPPSLNNLLSWLHLATTLSHFATVANWLVVSPLGSLSGEASNIRLGLPSATASAAIVWPSSHWNKYFWSQIFLDEQTELLSSTVSLYRHTKQPRIVLPASQSAQRCSVCVSTLRPASARFLLHVPERRGAKRIFETITIVPIVYIKLMCDWCSAFAGGH